MAITSLSPGAYPGKAYSFSPKAPSAHGPHTGDFTRLSAMAIPGGIHTFIAKDPSAGGGGGGEFNWKVWAHTRIFAS